MEHGWNLILVNWEYKIPKDWKVELTELSNGQRSLKRTLMDNVEEPLSALIIDGKLHEGDTVVVESDKAHGVKLRVA